MPKKNICKNCGKNIEPDYKFCCMDCGLKFCKKDGWQPAIIQTGKNSFELNLLPMDDENANKKTTTNS